MLNSVSYNLREGNFEFKKIHSKGSNKNKKYPENVSSVLYINSLNDAPTFLCTFSTNICEIRFYYPEWSPEMRISTVFVETIFLN